MALLEYLHKELRGLNEGGRGGFPYEATEWGNVQKIDSTLGRKREIICLSKDLYVGQMRIIKIKGWSFQRKLN